MRESVDFKSVEALRVCKSVRVHALSKVALVKAFYNIADSKRQYR